MLLRNGHYYYGAMREKRWWVEDVSRETDGVHGRVVSGYPRVDFHGVCRRSCRTTSLRPPCFLAPNVSRYFPCRICNPLQCKKVASRFYRSARCHHSKRQVTASCAERLGRTRSLEELHLRETRSDAVTFKCRPRVVDVMTRERERQKKKPR